MTEKRKYEKPSMKAFELEEQLELLVGSGPDTASFDNYEDGTFTW